MLRWRFRTHEAKGADPKTEPQRKGADPRTEPKQTGDKSVCCLLVAVALLGPGASCLRWLSVFSFFLFRATTQRPIFSGLRPRASRSSSPTGGTSGRERRAPTPEPELSGIPYAVTLVEFLFFLVGLAAALIDALSAQGSHCTGGVARLLHRRIPDVGVAQTGYACLHMKTAKLNEFVFAACFSKFLHHFLLLKR